MIQYPRMFRHLKGGLALGLAGALSFVGTGLAGAQAAPAVGEGSGRLAGSSVGAPIPVGGPNLETASAALPSSGSGQAMGAAGSLAASLGSSAFLAPLGSTSGSATASVASSGLLPGSTYVNATGSIGSGTIGLAGLVTFPEYVFGSLALNLATGYLTAVGERQAKGDLTDQEVSMWHGVVVGSATAGGTLEAAAAASGAELPGSLVGSIGAVKRSAAENPHLTIKEARSATQAHTAGAPATGQESQAGPSPTDSAATRGGTAYQATVALAQTGVGVGPVLGLSLLALLTGAAGLVLSRRRS